MRVCSTVWKKARSAAMVSEEEEGERPEDLDLDDEH